MFRRSGLLKSLLHMKVHRSAIPESLRRHFAVIRKCSGFPALEPLNMPNGFFPGALYGSRGTYLFSLVTEL